jgi:hypothetical protein
MTRFPPSLWLIAVAVIVSSLTRSDPPLARRAQGPAAAPRLVRAAEQPLPVVRAARVVPLPSGAATPSSRSRP